MMNPYNKKGSRVHGSRFREKIQGIRVQVTPKHKKACVA
jgi:hypothetical protein